VVAHLYNTHVSLVGAVVPRLGSICQDYR